MENGIYLIECGNGVVTMRRVAVLGDGEEVVVRKKSWKRDWYSLQDENAELKRKLDVVRSERMSYSKQVDGLREHAAIREQVVKDSGEQLDILQERFADLRGKLEDTTKALDDERNKRTEAERELGAAVARNAELLNELQRTTEYLKQAREAAADADRRATVHAGRLSSLADIAAGYRSTAEGLSRLLGATKESHNVRIAELEQKLAQAEADIETWRAQALTLERTSVGYAAAFSKPALKEIPIYGEASPVPLRDYNVSIDLAKVTNAKDESVGIGVTGSIDSEKG